MQYYSILTPHSVQCVRCNVDAVNTNLKHNKFRFSKHQESSNSAGWPKQSCYRLRPTDWSAIQRQTTSAPRAKRILLDIGKNQLRQQFSKVHSQSTKTQLFQSPGIDCSSHLVSRTRTGRTGRGSNNTWPSSNTRASSNTENLTSIGANHSNNQISNPTFR